MATYAYSVISNLSFGGTVYSVKDAQAYHIGDVLDPGTNTATTVGTSADPFAAVYATDYYWAGVKETTVPTAAAATSYSIATTIGSGSDTALATTSAVKAFASTTGNLTTTLDAGGIPYYFTGVSAATTGSKSGIYVAPGAYMKDGLLYSGGAQVLTSYTNTTYTFVGGTNSFTVTPSGGTAQTVNITPSIANNVTGSGASGYLAKWTGANVIANGPALGTDTTTYLRNDGTWAIPAGTYSLPTASASTLGGITTNYTATSTAGTVYNAPVAMSGTNAYVAMTKTAITTALNSSTLPTQTGSASYAISTSVSSSSTDAQIPTAKSVYTAMSAAIGLQLTATTAGTNYYFLLANASTGGSTSAAYVTSPLLYNNGTATFSGNFYASGTGFSLVANNGAILKTDSYIASNTSGSGAIYTNEQSNDYTAYGANAIVFDDSDGADHLLSFPKEDGTLLTTASTASSTTRGGVKIYSSGSTLYINT